MKNGTQMTFLHFLCALCVRILFLFGFGSVFQGDIF